MGEDLLSPDGCGDGLERQDRVGEEEISPLSPPRLRAQQSRPQSDRNACSWRIWGGMNDSSRCKRKFGRLFGLMLLNAKMKKDLKGRKLQVPVVLFAMCSWRPHVPMSLIP